MAENNRPSDQEVEAAAKVIFAAGRHYHWFDGRYEELDSIGRNEFDAIVEDALMAAARTRPPTSKWRFWSGRK